MKSNNTKPLICRVLATVLVVVLVIATTGIPSLAGGYQSSLVSALKGQVQSYLASTQDVTAAIDYAGTLNSHFKVGTTEDSSFNSHCWNHTSEMSNLLFDVGIPGGTGYYYLTGSSSYWSQVGQVVQPNASQVWNLLLTAQPGDLVQYVSTYTTSGNYSHTAMIYSNDGTTVKIYSFGSLKVSLKTVTSSNVYSALGTFGTEKTDKTRGMTLYRCSKAPAYSGGDENLAAFNNSIDQSIAGYYYLSTNDASVQSKPAADATTLRTLSHGEVIHVIAKGVNSYGNTWYKLENNEYIYPKTNQGENRLVRVPTAFYFEPALVSSFNSSLSDSDYVFTQIYVNGNSTFSDITSFGCIIYEKNGSTYTEVARATDSKALNSNGRMFYNVSQSPTSSNTKFYATGTSNVFSFTPNHTYYYRMFIEYSANNSSIAYSYNFPADSEYYSFVAAAATQVTATYSDLAAVNVTATSAAISYRCTVSGTATTNVSDVSIYLYSSNGQSLGRVYQQTPSFSGNYDYFLASTSNPDVMTYDFQPETTYKARVCATILGNQYYSPYISFTTLSCAHVFGDWTVGLAPTCEDVGYYERTCTICGYKEHEDYEALGHNYGAPTWTWYNNTRATAKFTCTRNSSHTQTIEATITSTVVSAATCDSAGVVKYTATVSFNGQTYTNTTTDTIPELGHNYGAPTWTWNGVTSASAKFTCTRDSGHTQTVTATITSVETTAATCETDGVRTYTATVTFNGQTYTNTKAGTIAALGHNYGTPTWTWNGYTSASAKFTCTRNSSHTQTVNATITSAVTTAATCETAGVRTYTATVTFNGQTYTNTKTETIPALDHNYGAPVWTWNGYASASAKFTCARDNSHTQTVTATITSAVTTAPTCETAGVRTYTATVTFNGQAYTNTKTETFPGSGHHYDFGSPTWTWNGYTSASVKFTCTHCGNQTQPVTATITNAVTTAATCTTSGVRTYTATAVFNGQTYTNTKTETIAPHGHDYGTPSYTWANDYSTVTATRVCSYDSSHKETETVNTTSEVTKQPTFEANGETTYTAVFANPAFATQTKVVANIPKLTDPDITFTIGTATGKAGENVKVPLSVSGKTQVAGLIMYNFTYDTSKLEFVGFTDFGTLVTGSVAGASSVNSTTGIINLGYQTALVPEGVICYAEFKIKDGVEDCTVAVSCSVSASYAGAEVSNTLVPGSVKVLNWIHGDFNNDGIVDMEDAVYFIGWINFSYLGDMYVITYDGNMDFNNDGSIDMEDAVYFIGWINFSYLGDMYVINW